MQGMTGTSYKAPTLFGIFFALLLKHAFKRSTDGVYLHSRSDGCLFNILRLHAKTKTRTVTIRDLLFADDVAMVSHQQDGLQRLIDKFSDAFDLFGLTISQKKTQVMGQVTPAPPCITVSSKELEVAHQFQYLGSTTTDTLSLDVELRKDIGKASTSLSKLTKRVWENKHLTIPTKINVYKACVISTLLYGSESWTTYSTQEQKLQVFHLRCLCRILGITWQDKVWNNDVLLITGVPSMFTLLHQCCLCWLGHVHRMEDGHIPKDLLYGELATGTRCRGHLQLCYKDVCKHGMKACNIDTDSWEAFADDRTLWKQQVSQGLKRGEAAFQEKMMKDGPGEQPDISRTTKNHIKHLSSHVRDAAEIANPGLASTATQDDAHQQPLRVLCHSWVTDECQGEYLYYYNTISDT